jgi:glycine/D-amino acid oxidase-like deaminating enzyme
MFHQTHYPSILIIGGGTWGCATALQLVRRGYKSITVLDAHSIPSPISAGNDVNKIMEEGKAHQFKLDLPAEQALRVSQRLPFP